MQPKQLFQYLFAGTTSQNNSVRTYDMAAIAPGLVCVLCGQTYGNAYVFYLMGHARETMTTPTHHITIICAAALLLKHARAPAETLPDSFAGCCTTVLPCCRTYGRKPKGESRIHRHMISTGAGVHASSQVLRVSSSRHLHRRLARLHRDSS